MSPLLQRKGVRLGLFTAGLVVLLIFFSRHSLLQLAFGRVQQRLLHGYGVGLQVGQLRFSGWDEVEMKQLSLQPVAGDTLLRMDELRVDVSLSDLVRGYVGFDEVLVKNAQITIVNLPQRNNWRWLLRPAPRQVPTESDARANYNETAQRLQQRLLRLFNMAFSVQNFTLRYTDSSGTDFIRVPLATYNLERFSATVLHPAAGDSLLLSGSVPVRNRSYRFSIQHRGNPALYLPFFNHENGLRIGFQSIAASVEVDDEDANVFRIRSRFHTEDFRLQHWRLAQQAVVLPRTSFSGLFHISPQAVELDSSSTLSLQDLQAHLFLHFHAQPDSFFALQLHIPETPSDTFFNALPQGMFQSLRGLSCSGSLQYSLQLAVPMQQPDSLLFSSTLRSKNLSLRHYGAENFARINGPFVYEAYAQDHWVRNIEVSPANPHYTPLPAISPLLVKSVLQAEDPSFLLHRGFLEEAFRESIIQNYKERRFARGGSTISMQLVKNVFLSRQKTVARKAEEALIVYLIENLHLVSKERMLEVYLNVIEWGPGVYGIGEAAQFYFGKTPATLTLPESIFLASIIPRPRNFKYQLTPDGQLRPHLADFFRILSSRMIGKGWIGPADTINMMNEVQLRGPALGAVQPQAPRWPE